MSQLPKAVVFLVLTTACTLYRPPSPVPRAPSPRDQYENQLLRSDLGRTTAYTEWSNAGRRALRDRLSIRPSFRELLHFLQDRPTAVGYRLNLRRGQRVRLELERRTSARVFTEFFEEIGSNEAIFRLVRSAPDNASHIVFEATTDGPHVLRIQPELYKGGEVVVILSTAAALTFPVAGKTARAIGSRFGEARDGGARAHEGIDIFAPANTPVIAVAAGIITSVANTPVGGNVVWQEDPERNVTYYYAHLTSQSVQVGDRVQPGAEIGRVGNTGNARTTPSHLHFAVYQPGRIAINPEPFLFDQPGDVIAPLLVDAGALGNLRAARTDGVALRNEPRPTAATTGTLSRYDDLYVIGGVRDWYRVRLADGRTGFLRSTELGPALASKGAQ
jgi:murein DD-endopeptidase MepM/ murein hydrolase activator NlpD